MIRILFADDDAIIRRVITKMIDWSAEGFELVHISGDSFDALEYAEHNPVDVLLTDIKMPVIDGLELSRRIRKLLPNIEIILISGHEEFSYAKQALTLNVLDYLIKPISSEQIVEVLRRTYLHIQQKTQTQDIIHRAMPAIRRQYLAQVLDSAILDVDEANRAGLTFHDGIGITGTIAFSFTRTSAQSGNILLSQSFCDEMEARLPGLTLIPRQKGTYFFLYLTSPAPNAAELISGLLNRIIPTLSDIPYTLDLHAPFTTIEDLLSSAGIAQKTSPQVSTCEGVRMYIDQHFQDSGLSLTQLADQFSINHCHLTSHFKKETGQSIYSYIISKRMQKAKELLLTTDLKIYEIAEAVGYQDSQYFSKSFHKYYGQSISDFRDSNQ